MVSWCLFLLIAGTVPLRANDTLITEYALTSANDFPQRDPRNWCLQASRDGGVTWVTVDTRTNEVFPNRHQRRVFQVTQPGAFSNYRLEIDQVFDRRVDSVQLAEIEVFDKTGRNVSPLALLGDQITAKGDNLPSETVDKLFDGKVETKWLDRISNHLAAVSWVQWDYRPAASVVLTNINQLLSLRARAADAYRAAIKGVFAQAGNGRAFVLDSGGWTELVGITPGTTWKTGQRIIAEGLTMWTNNRVCIGQLQIQAIGLAPQPQPRRIWLEQPLADDEDLDWVEVQGSVQFGNTPGPDVSFEIEEGASSIRVRLGPSATGWQLPPAGTRLVVRGICRAALNPKGQRVAAELWVSDQNAITLAVDNAPVAKQLLRTPATQPSDSTALTKIDQIRKLSLDQLNRRPWIKIRGVITVLLGAFIQDDTAGIEISFPNNEGRKLTEPGLFVEIEGWAGAGAVGNPIISVDRVTVLGRGKLPEPQRLTLRQMAGGGTDAEWVEVDGVVRSTDGAHLAMVCYGRDVMASIVAADVSAVNRLVDAAVRVRGVAITALDDRGRIQGLHLLIPSLEQIDVVEPPAPVSSLPVRPIGSLLSLNGPRESYHRVRVEGTVTRQDNQRFFLQDATGGAMAVFRQAVTLDARFGNSRWLFWQSTQTNTANTAECRVMPGDRVQVSGFPETHGYSPVLTEVVVEKLNTRGAVAPQTLTPEALADGSVDSALVTLTGVVRAETVLGTSTVVMLEWGDRTLQVFCPTPRRLGLAPGTRVRVTGVCEVEPVPFAELGLRTGGARILARAGDDLAILAQPPFWTVRRALAVTGGLAVAMIAALVWITQLRRQVEERSSQLAAEIQLRERTERQSALEKERARIAQDLHDDLGANLTQIVFLSQRVEQARVDGQEVTWWFNRIPATARRTIQSLDEIVWAINPRHDSLESLANYLSQFAQQHMMLAGVRCILAVPTVLPAVALSAEIRHKLVLATREALQNVAAHAHASEVWVSLTLDETALTIVVADNGRGFDPEQAKDGGNGLANMRQRLSDLGGRLELTSKPGQGTTVQFILPANGLHARVIGGNGALASP